MKTGRIYGKGGTPATDTCGSLSCIPQSQGKNGTTREHHPVCVEQGLSMLGPMAWSCDSSVNIGDKVGQSCDMRGPITELSKHLKHSQLVTKGKPRDFPKDQVRSPTGRFYLP